jgi:hypothetical protein
VVGRQTDKTAKFSKRNKLQIVPELPEISYLKNDDYINIINQTPLLDEEKSEGIFMK